MAKKSYEKLQKELEKTLKDIESNELPVDKLLESVTRAKEILIECRSRLRSIEEQLENKKK